MSANYFRRQLTRWGLAALFLGLLGALVTVNGQLPAARAEGPAVEKSLDYALAKHARPILDAIRKQLGKDQASLNVGVLKFLAQKGDAPLSDNVGPINQTLANRLETALILAARPEDHLGILQRATQSVVSGWNTSANHLTGPGRASLFDSRFNLSWGVDKKMATGLEADVFVTGRVKISPDLKVLDVTVEGFDRKNAAQAPVLLDNFRASMDVRTLTEAAESYLIPKGVKVVPKDPETPPDEPVVLLAYDVEAKRQPNPVTAKEAPVKLKIFYNGQLMAIREVDGRAEVAEPREETKVTFELDNTDDTYRYGVVLMVNGENTLYRQTGDVGACSKWVLNPGEKVSIAGFQTRNQTLEQFKVLPDEKSEEQAVRYGNAAGQFTFAVFREDKDGTQPSPAAAPAVKDEDQVRAAIVRAAIFDITDPKRPDSLLALQGALRGGDAGAHVTASKGVIVPDKVKPNAVQVVDFKYDPLPIMTATIFYYKPHYTKAAP
jgi:hypothetical protein